MYMKIKKNFFHLNKFKKLKYVVSDDQKSNKEDLDILTNNYYLFKRLVDCHSYKKNLNLILILKTLLKKINQV